MEIKKNTSIYNAIKQLDIWKILVPLNDTTNNKFIQSATHP